MHALVTQVSLGPRSLPPLIGGFIGLALALFLALRRGQPRVRLWFAAVSLSSALWSFADAVALGAESAGLQDGLSPHALTRATHACGH